MLSQFEHCLVGDSEGGGYVVEFKAWPTLRGWNVRSFHVLLKQGVNFNAHNCSTLLNLLDHPKNCEPLALEELSLCQIVTELHPMWSLSQSTPTILIPKIHICCFTISFANFFPTAPESIWTIYCSEHLIFSS